MRIHKPLVTAVMLAIGCGLAAPALYADTQTTVEKTTTTTKHHYMYYPEHHIYFAPESKTYYWENNGRWVSGTDLPPENRAYVASGGVAIDLDTDKPYERNSWVIAHYKDRDVKRDDDGEEDD